MAVEEEITSTRAEQDRSMILNFNRRLSLGYARELFQIARNYVFALCGNSGKCTRLRTFRANNTFSPLAHFCHTNTDVVYPDSSKAFPIELAGFLREDMLVKTGNNMVIVCPDVNDSKLSHK